MSAEGLSGLRLLTAATVAMTLFLLFMGGGLWALSPDLEDGAPPDPTLPDVIEGPKAVGAGMSAAPRRRITEETPEKTGEAATKTPTAATETPKAGTGTPKDPPASGEK